MRLGVILIADKSQAPQIPQEEKITCPIEIPILVKDDAPYQ